MTTLLSPHQRQSVIGALGMGVLEKGVRPVPPEQDDWLKRGMKWSPFSSLFHLLGGASAVSFFAGVRIEEEEEEEEEEKMKEHLSYLPSPQS